ncbi:hypothetical protein [Rheinheimera maricola]|uniref:Uncharacterized protein n=1 Tax=Rheinheimera maricola TaxID=2793282 RepID=A0ABS7X967_9GAMM|nr:hypothetical protein [Rheinheimera maricola]MBZ9612084.1 hypothetical protein [Rheinheimera maricola]
MTLNRLMALLCGAVLLTACGGGSDTKDTGTGGGANAPLSMTYYGMWQLDGDTYVGISDSSITTYVNDPTQGCMEVGLFNIVTSTVNSVVTEDAQTGERSTSLFAMNGANLRVTEDNVTLEFVAGDYPHLSQACGVVSGASSIAFALQLDYLPPVVRINRDAQLTGRVEYQYGVHFDINRNNVADPGDVLVQLQHYKSSSGSAEDIALPYLGANIWAVFPRKQALGTTTTTSSTTANSVQVQQSASTLTFNVDMRTHPLMRFVDAQTPMFVYTYINYPQPEAEVIAEWLDGPWNWSSETHQDRYPDVGLTQPNFHADMQMTDASGDLIKGEAKWVDIKGISLRFIE